MKMFCQNGFLVQELYDCPHSMEEIIHTFGYQGLSDRNDNPLSVRSDGESRRLSEEANWRRVSSQEYILLEFISDPNILLRYLQTCRKQHIPIRLLFVESDYSEEVWTGPDIPKRFLGYEYNTIPIDNQIITDLSWYRPLAPFWKRMNSLGLFPSLDEVTAFKNAYDRAFNAGEIGDGDMQTHIFCIYEVQTEDVLRCLTK